MPVTFFTVERKQQFPGAIDPGNRIQMISQFFRNIAPEMPEQEETFPHDIPHPIKVYDRPVIIRQMIFPTKIFRREPRQPTCRSG